jgi:SAM-dependent methyltransferase
MDPLAGSSWSAPGTVAGFSQSLPNDTLIHFAAEELQRPGAARALDIGAGAARNTVPLAQLGWQVLATDLSWPMVVAGAARAREANVGDRVQFVLAPMDRLPAADDSVDLVIAHGIWNLARSGTEFRSAVREAARAARDGAALFVFTFSHNTLPDAAQPVLGEEFVYTEFSGQPQCFLTEEQLISELAAEGFELDPRVPLREHNRRKPGALRGPMGPVIYEAAFRRIR